MVYSLLYAGRHPRYARPAAGFSPASSFLLRGGVICSGELAHDPVGSCAEVMLARRTQNAEKNAQSRTIRVHIGERLKAYYDEMQHAQPDDRLAKLMQYLSEQLEAENSGAK